MIVNTWLNRRLLMESDSPPNRRIDWYDSNDCASMEQGFVRRETTKVAALAGILIVCCAKLKHILFYTPLLVPKTMQSEITCCGVGSTAADCQRLKSPNGHVHFIGDI